MRNHTLEIMATALKRTVYTRTSGATAALPREVADPALQRFLDAVWTERGLSTNTLAAYRADLTALARWLAEHNRHHPAVLVWGAGRVTRRRLTPLTAHGVVIQGYIDVDPGKVGRTLGGRPVLDFRELPPAGSTFVTRVGGRR